MNMTQDNINDDNVSFMRNEIYNLFSKHTKGYGEWYGCFPFEEQYMMDETKNTLIPPLSSKFLDQEEWEIFAEEYLQPGFDERPNYKAFKYCVLNFLPSENEILPCNLIEGCVVENVFRYSESGCVYSVKIADQNCVLKMIPLKECIKESEAVFTRRSLQENKKKKYGKVKKVYLAQPWNDIIVYSRVHSTKFYGNVLIYYPPKREFYSCYLMPLFRSTMDSFCSSIIGLYGHNLAPLPPLNQVQSKELAETLLVYFFQVFFVTIPFGKKRGLRCHNDLKMDNIAYRHTTKRFLYLCIDGQYVCLPTLGRLFYLIDFGWSTFFSKKDNLLSCSFCPIENLHTPMKPDNELNDFTQFTYSFFNSFIKYMKKMKCDWDNIDPCWEHLVYLKDILFPESNDPFLCTTKNIKQIYRTLYNKCSEVNQLHYIKDLVCYLCENFPIHPNQIPKGRYVLRYDFSLFESE